MTLLRLWAPGVIFILGSVLISGVRGQQHMELTGDLQRDIPREILGLRGEDVVLAEGEVEVAGMDTYLLRTYSAADSMSARVPPFSLYVGFYGSQAQGRTIHSPKNCMPGAGWEALNDREATITIPGGEDVPVNRYILERDDERVMVLYWYQGRGRVQANEYRVKLDLLRDSALHGRSDEALVRIVVPLESSEDAAFEAASRIAAEVVPAVESAVPEL